MKCVMCNGSTGSMMVDHKEFGISLGRFKADVCRKCSETYYDEQTAKIIQEKSKEKGLFGLARRATVAEIGNSIAIRIPKELAKFVGLKKGEEVTLVPDSRRSLHVEI